MEWEGSTLPLTVQAELLSVSRSSLYYQAVPPSAAEIAIKHRIDESYTECPFYGSRRILAQLRREGTHINRKRVQHYMREMGIQGICPGANLSKRSQAHAVYSYLLRNITAAYPNHIWGIDITYIRLHQGWMYLVAILDWFSRYVVTWQLDDSLAIDFVLAVVDQALAQQRPLLWNSDQGSHFTSSQYIQRLLDANIQISMDGKGRALDNILPNGFGALSNMRRFTYMIIALPNWHPKTWQTTFFSTINAVLTNHLAISPQVRSTSNIFFNERGHGSYLFINSLTFGSTLNQGRATSDF